MKIRKITDYTEKGVIEEKFNLIIEEREEGWELDIKEMTALRELINVAVGSVPTIYIPETISDQFTKDFNRGIALLSLREEMEEPPEEPVVSKSMGAGLIEKEPEIVCENGACRLVLEDEEPEVKERKKPGRKANRDFSKYISMYNSGVDQKEIRELMQEEMQISNLTADQYFYVKVKKAAKAKEVINEPQVIEKEKKQLPKEIKPKINKNKVDPELFEVMDNLPHYSTPQQFKDACAAADIGRGKLSIGFLKEIYLDTHPTVRW